jgi:hypothetical protein
VSLAAAIALGIRECDVACGFYPTARSIILKNALIISTFITLIEGKYT